MKKFKVFDLLTKMAEDVNSFGNARVTSAIVMKNDIISFGFNERKTHPLQSRFATNPMAIYRHAEIASIINGLRRISVDDFKKCDIYVARIKKDKSWGLAMPCKGCTEAISNFGLRNVYYTTDITNVFECG